MQVQSRPFLEPIAIVGMSGVFPEAENVDRFWSNLCAGRSSISDLPADRGWSLEDYYDPVPKVQKTYARRGGFLSGIDLFDPLFFEIQPSSAALMDPSARLFLQEAWRAIEHGGVSAADLQGSQCGLFFCAKGDYPNLIQRYDPLHYAASDSFAPSRFGYHLNLIGPAMSIDTACSSTLAAVAWACDSLALGTCDAAIVGGGGVCSTPNTFVTLSQMRLLSPDDECFAFDERANGTVLGEAIGAAFLKRLRDAERDGDRVLAVIRGWGSNQDGRTNGPTAPSGASQTRLQTAVYRRFGIDPRRITMLEAHGTGTKLGDPIEVTALTNSFREFTSDAGFCAIGSLKTNIGHTFFAAGICSLIKVVQALRHQSIPPTLNVRVPNPGLRIDGSPFFLNTELSQWESDQPRCAAINSFGATGFNVHVVVEEYQPRDVGTWSPPVDGPELYAVPLSAKTPDVLRERARDLRNHLSRVVSSHESTEGEALPHIRDLAYTLQTGRSPFAVRACIFAASIEELNRGLDGFLNGASFPAQSDERHVSGRITGDLASRIANQKSLAADVEVACSAGDQEELGRLWVAGADVPWVSLYGEGSGQPRRLGLPTYPFEKRPCWITDLARQEAATGQHRPAGDAAGAERLHPLLHRNTSTLDEIRFSSTFTGDEFFLEDHRIQGNRLLPGVAYLEMAHAAAVEALGDEAHADGFGIRLRNVVWIQPFVYDDDNRTIHIALMPDGRSQAEGNDRGGERRLEFEVFSGDPAGDDVRVHAQGIIEAGHTVSPERIDLDELRSTIDDYAVGPQDLYPMLWEMGFNLGERLQGVDRLTAASGQCLGRLALPAGVPTDFRLHPTFLDSALQTGMGMALGPNARGDSYRQTLPFALQEVDVLGECAKRMWAWVRYSDGSSPGGKVVRTDIDLCDDDGNVRIKMHGYTTRALDRGRAGKSSSAESEITTTWLRPKWQPAPLPAEPAELPHCQRHLVCFEPAGTVLEGCRLLCQRQPEIQLHHEPLVGSHAADVFVEAALALFRIVRSCLDDLAQHKVDSEEVLVQVAIGASGAEHCLDGLSAMLKTARQENGRLLGQLLLPNLESSDEVGDETGVEAVAERVGNDALDATTQEVRYVDGERQVRVFAEVERNAGTVDHGLTDGRATLQWRDGGVYLVTGGAGGIGLIMAQEIVHRCPSAKLILVGRSEAGGERLRQFEALRDTGGVQYRRVDVSDASEVCALIEQVVTEHGALHGVIHSAGVLRDNYVSAKYESELAEVLASKVRGLANLDEATADLELDFFIAFSSIAGAWGNAGQIDYAAANAFMDSYLATRRRRVEGGARHGRSLSIGWPLWRDGGMAVDEAYEKLMAHTAGLVPLETDPALEAFYQAFRADADHVLVLRGDAGKLHEYLRQRTGEGSGGSLVTIREAQVLPEGVDAEQLHTEIVTRVSEVISELISIDLDRLDPYAELSEFGMDSISLTQLSNLLNEQYVLTLEPTLFFEYSTLYDFGTYLVEQFGLDLATRLELVDAAALPPAAEEIDEPESPPVETASRRRSSRRRGAVAEESSALERLAGAVPAEAGTVDRDEPIAIVGISGRFPQAEDPEAFWNNLFAERDCIAEVPADRWDWRELFGDPLEEPGKTNIKWGGFMDAIGDFDPAFFSISPKEAEKMDPQQRLLMLYVWKAIEDSGHAPSSLAGTNTALFIATHDSGYDELFPAAGLDTDLSATPTSMGPNRMSYFLGIHGPSEPVETACSSSLVAIHRGIGSIRIGDCDMAVVGGVETLITPTKHISFSQAGVLSPDGRCKTFSDQANGYVRGEGVAMLVLRKLSAAQADGDHIYGVIRGSGINHGGRANSVTAPNPRAQAELIERVYRQAAVDPRTVGYIEAHGTGTALGDPIEINGLKSAFGRLYDATADVSEVNGVGQHCGIGSVKTNVGHLELAAGVTGVLKVLMQMRHQQLVKTLHCEPVNRHIALQGSPFYLVSQTRPWPRVSDREGHELPYRAGVSSFGVGGVNAHVLLEEYREPATATQPSDRYCIVLSARSEEQLVDYARSLRLYLKRQSDAGNERMLPGIAYTLQVGRDAMEERVGFLVSGASDLREQLDSFMSGDSQKCYRGRVNRVGGDSAFTADTDMAQVVAAWIDKGKHTKVLDVWSKGYSVDWQRLYGERRPRRVPLPGYPFRLERYWITESRGKRSAVEALPVAGGTAAASPASDPPREMETEQMTVKIRLDPVDGDPNEAIPRSKRAAAPPMEPEPGAVETPGDSGSATDPVSVGPLSAEVLPAVDLDTLQEQLLHSLAEALFLTPVEVDPDQTFVDMGLDSVVGVEWIRAVNKQYGSAVKVTKVYDYPTLTAFTEFMHGMLLAPPQENGKVAGTGAEPPMLEEHQGLASRLCEELAGLLGMRPEDVGLDQPFEGLGLDTFATFRLREVVEALTGHRLEMTFAVDYPDVRSLAAYLESAPPPETRADDAPALEPGAGESAARPATTGEASVTAPADLKREGVANETRPPAGEYGLVVRNVHRISEVSFEPWQVDPPGAGEITVQVRASAINFPDTMCIEGLYPTMPAYPFVPGFEVVGVVTATGDGVDTLTPGDEVVALTGDVLGGHASQVNVPAAHAARKPPELGFVDVCSLPVAFGTTLTAFQVARLTPGETVLVQTASGACGLMAIQLARLAGCRVFGTSSKEAKRTLLEGLPLEGVLDYTDDFDQQIQELTAGRGVDVVLNMVGGDAIQKGLNCLAPSGRYLELAVHALHTSSRLDLSRLTDNQSVHSIDLRRRGRRRRVDAAPQRLGYLEQMLAMMVRGQVESIVSRIYPPGKIGDALNLVRSGRHVGKVVIDHDASESVVMEAECFERVATQSVRHAGERPELFTPAPMAAPERPSTPSPSVHASGRLGRSEARHEGVAIIGMAGRFPMSPTLDVFWENLREGRSCITEIPFERWGVDRDFRNDPRRGERAVYSAMGTLEDVDHFDPLFFNISPKEARLMDPQQRLYLQSCWSCIEEAGYAPSSLSGQRCGVFVGCGSGGYGMLHEADISAHQVMGSASSILAARISYLLDLKGPCLAIDTACSSALVAIAEACNSIAMGGSDLALAGGVCVLSTPTIHAMAAEGGMLSVDGRCFTFDSRANGFVPAEGVGVVLLKSIDAALCDGDRIHGIIRGWGINHDGKTNGMTAPSVVSQRALEKEVYTAFAIDPASISYVEAHGTGTQLGDPIEVEALISSFRTFTQNKGFCALGSVKSNIGHALPAAAAASVIKVLMAIREHELPPTINFESLNEEIALADSPFYVNDRLRPWHGEVGKPRRAAVSSFSYNGTNAHIVVEEPPQAGAMEPAAVLPRNVVVLSAKTHEQLDEQVRELSRFTERELARCADADQRRRWLGDMAYTLQIGRDAMVERLAFCVDSPEDAARKLAAAARGEAVEGLKRGNVRKARRAAGKRSTEQTRQGREAVEAALSSHDVTALASLWVAGADVDWMRLYATVSPCRMTLPTYPFARESYWYTDQMPALTASLESEKASSRSTADDAANGAAASAGLRRRLDEILEAM